MTIEDTLDGFQVPDTIHVILSTGGSMRGRGRDIAEIKRQGSHYSIGFDIGQFNGRGKALVDSAVKILGYHAEAALHAKKMLYMKEDHLRWPNEMNEKHLAQQKKFCVCGKRGFLDFSFGAVNRKGVATIEYKCIIYGNIEEFTIDHSR